MSAKAEVLQHYLDEDGQITVDRDPSKWSTGNGLMHLGFFMCLLWGSDQLELADEIRFYNAVKACEDEPGVYDRNPGRNDRNAHDDANGIVAASVCAKAIWGMPWFHKEVLIHGLKNFFIYENVDGKFNGLRDLWACRLRFPFIILWYFLVNQWLRGLLPIMLIFLTFSLRSKRADSLIMDYCKVESLAARYKWLKFYRNWWLRRANLTERTAEYFNKEGQPEHGLVALSRELKEK